MEKSFFLFLLVFLIPIAGIAQVEDPPINPINASIEDLMKLVPEGLTFIPDIAYREGSEAWKLDLVMPENMSDNPRPALVFIHGGGWRNGDKRNRNFFDPCIDFALKGYVCVTINYRLFGEADGIDDCIADVKCAVRWLRANTKKYNVDPERFGAYGNSAGAHLVSILGLCPKSAGMEGDGPYQEYSSMVQAVVSSATPASFMIPMSNRARLAQEQQQNQQQLSTAQQETRSRFDMPEEMRKMISPITYVNADAPPFILVHDVSDATVGVYQSDEFVKALKEAGAKDVTYKRYDNGSGHGVFFKNIEETGPMREEFFDRVLMNNKN
jgi:acetyl esterase/lipase